VPSIEENLKQWNEDYDWQLAGDSWSGPWGSATAQWYGSIYPRIRRFLPASSILEIAPGFGRWTQFLLEHCDTLIGVDIAPRCVDACRQRFADRPGAVFEVNDGRSLPTVTDLSIDFAFSFDSLVHVEAGVVRGYLTELARVLAPGGVAFLHHSNYGSYQRSARALALFQGVFGHMPAKARRALFCAGAYRSVQWRAPSVSAARFAELCEDAGLRCAGQELVNWAGGVILLDSFSVVTRPGSPWDRSGRMVKNRMFRSEACSVRRSSSVYDTPSLPTN
jgi:SAM-dependent methyltransferase